MKKILFSTVASMMLLQTLVGAEIKYVKSEPQQLEQVLFEGVLFKDMPLLEGQPYSYFNGAAKIIKPEPNKGVCTLILDITNAENGEKEQNQSRKIPFVCPSHAPSHALLLSYDSSKRINFANKILAESIRVYKQGAIPVLHYERHVENVDTEGSTINQSTRKVSNIETEITFLPDTSAAYQKPSK